MEIAVPVLVQALNLLEVPLWLPKKNAVTVTHDSFQVVGDLKFASWLIITDPLCKTGEPSADLLRHILWSVGVEEPQWICVAPIQHALQKTYSWADLRDTVHPTFILSFGINVSEFNPSPGYYLELPWSLNDCINRPLLKQQVMYELYHFMHLSVARTLSSSGSHGH